LKGGRLTIRCIEGTGLRKRDDRSVNPRVDPYIKFKLGAADKHPWKQTKVKRKQDSNPKFDNEVITFDVITPGEYITDEEIHLNIEVWNKGTFKDELLGVVTMSTTRFFQNPYISFEENVPVALPGDRSSTSKVCHITYYIYNIMLCLILYFWFVFI
jgi:Ca2+-dependent lipid-binding protein